MFPKLLGLSDPPHDYVTLSAFLFIFILPLFRTSLASTWMMQCKCQPLWAVIRDRLEQSSMNHPSSKCTLFSYLYCSSLSIFWINKVGVDGDRARQRISFAFCLALFFLFHPSFHFWSSHKTSTDPEIQAEGWRIWWKQLEEHGFTRRPMCPSLFFVVNVKFVVETKHCDYFFSCNILPCAFTSPFFSFIHRKSHPSVHTHVHMHSSVHICCSR